MTIRTQNNGSLRAIDFSHHLSHYLGVFWRSKWYILTAGPLVAITVLVLIINFYNISPQLSATAIIGLENTSDVTAVKDAGGIGEGRGDLISSRNFLSGIIEAMSLRMKMKKFTRSEVFDSVKVSPTAPEGSYLFLPGKKKNGWSYNVKFKEDGAGTKWVSITSGNISKSPALNFPGVHTVFSEQFLKRPHKFAFSINSLGFAIDELIAKLSVVDADRIKGRFNITVSLAGTDYKLITDCVNTIADDFVQKNLSFRRQKAQNTIEVLQKQYQTAYEELNSAEIALKNFRTSNPRVGLSMEVTQTITTLSDLETNSYSFKSSLSEGNDLKQRFMRDTGESRLATASEVLAFLSGRDDPFAPVLQADLTDLLVQQRELKRNNYSKEHPIYQENMKKITDVEKNIGKTLDDFISNLQKKITDHAGDIGSLSSELRTLPGKELKLAQLQRRQQICSEVYTMVMNRYNQAKVADAEVVTDVFVMDHAIVPVTPPLNLPQFLAVSVFLGLLFSIGPVIILDKIDKTARTVHEFKQHSDKLVLESIPVISHSVFMNAPPLELPDTSSYSGFPLFTPSTTKLHYYVNEVLKALRTKILMKLHDVQDKSLVVTSIERGAGKTTIASNLACIVAQTNMRTLLIDGDMRCGRVHKIFACQNENGFQELLSTQGAISEATVMKYVKPTNVPNLSIITSGGRDDNPSELLASSQLVRVKELLSGLFDMVIMDCPPLGAVTDAAVVYKQFSYYCIVVKAGSTNIYDLMRKLKEYPLVEKKVLGIILNFSVLDKNLSYYKNTKYYTLCSKK
jgi:capsular exopolysaccharide synthesis family protein